MESANRKLTEQPTGLADLGRDPVLLAERAKYDQVWRLPQYRVKSHGLNLWMSAPEIFPDPPGRVLDIGCGLGRLFGTLRDNGVDAWGVDWIPHALEAWVAERHGAHFVQSCIWDMTWERRFNLGVCTDVMEHIPEERVARSLDAIAAACELVVFKIANFPSNSLGAELHPTQRPAEWWMDQMTAQGGAVEILPVPSGKRDFVIRWRP